MRRGFEKVSGYEYVNFPKRKTEQSETEWPSHVLTM